MAFRRLGSRAVGAFPLTSGSRDAALVFIGIPGNYTLEISASDAPATGSLPKTGVVLAEVYEIN